MESSLRDFIGRILSRVVKMLLGPTAGSLEFLVLVFLVAASSHPIQAELLSLHVTHEWTEKSGLGATY